MIQTLDNQFLTSKGKTLPYDFTSDSDRSVNDMVIFCHGYKGFKDWGAWGLVAQSFAAKGFGFIKFNYSGNGTTTDNLTAFVDEEAFRHNTYTLELEETLEFIDFVKTNAQDWRGNEDLRIHIVGHSRGGGIALLAASESDQVTTCATWAAVNDFGERFPFGTELERWHANGELSVKNARTGQVLYHDINWYNDFKTNEERLYIRQAAKQFDRPLFVAHSLDDPAVHVSAGMKLNKWVRNSEFLLLDEGGHTFGSAQPWEDAELPTELEKVVNANIDFIQKHTASL